MSDHAFQARPDYPIDPLAPDEAPLLVIDRGADAKVVLHGKTFAGRRVLDVRVYQRRGRGWHPTNGIQLRISEIRAVLKKLALFVDGENDGGVNSDDQHKNAVKRAAGRSAR